VTCFKEAEFLSGVFLACLRKGKLHRVLGGVGEVAPGLGQFPEEGLALAAHAPPWPWEESRGGRREPPRRATGQSKGT
jgi:hypothetical protein